MRTHTFTAIEAALTFATFSAKDVETQLTHLLHVSDEDLDGAGFEESAAGEEACEDLIEAIRRARALP